MQFLKAFFSKFFLKSSGKAPALPAFVSLWAVLFLFGLTVRSVLSPVLFAVLFLFYRKTLKPGASTHKNDWKYVNFKLPDSPTTATYVVRVTQFQINNDWVKTIMRKHQPVKKCPVHI